MRFDPSKPRFLLASPIGGLAKLALATGLRPSECLSLTWDCIDWRARTAKVNGRVVQLNPYAVKVFRGQQATTNQRPTSTELVFHNPRTRRPWSKSALYREFKRAEIAQPTRTLRGEFVRLSLEAGESRYWIASQLGYKHFANFERRYGDIRVHERPQETRSRSGHYPYPQSLYDGHRLSVLLSTGKAPGVTVRKVGVIVDDRVITPFPQVNRWTVPANWLWVQIDQNDAIATKDQQVIKDMC